MRRRRSVLRRGAALCRRRRNRLAPCPHTRKEDRNRPDLRSAFLRRQKFSRQHPHEEGRRRRLGRHRFCRRRRALCERPRRRKRPARQHAEPLQLRDDKGSRTRARRKPRLLLRRLPHRGIRAAHDGADCSDAHRASEDGRKEAACHLLFPRREHPGARPQLAHPRRPRRSLRRRLLVQREQGGDDRRLLNALRRSGGLPRCPRRPLEASGLRTCTLHERAYLQARSCAAGDD